MNKNMDYNWKRFWVKRDGTYLYDLDGFLFDPESDNSKYQYQDVYSFEYIKAYPCLILLGEPGIGKSTVIEQEFESLNKQLKNEVDNVIYYNLKDYGDENRLINELFKSPQLSDWIKSENKLTIFIDSFDECHAEIPKLHNIFKRQFNNIKDYSKRLNIRIGCRTGAWPESLSSFFIDFYGKDFIEFYELAPLRRKDVVEAAKTKEIKNEEQFVNAIVRKNIQNLASNPITLNFLLNYYKDKNDFLESRYELYLNGCKLLCNENNPGRVESKSLQTNLSVEKRFALASRIASVMVFCNYNSIYNQEILNHDSGLVLSLSMIQEGEEYTDEYPFNYTINDLKETITQTALFTSRGPARFGFSHQSYMEFLAARYILKHNLDVTQIHSLLKLSHDSDKKVIPQLKTTSAWISSISRGYRADLIKTDPYSLLSSDIGSFETDDRKELVAALLKECEQNKIIRSEWGMHDQFYNLNHPGLVEQLRPFIEDSEINFFARRLAINISEACNLKELQNSLLTLVFDKEEDIYLRDDAILAMTKIADGKNMIKLKTFAVNKHIEDIENDLKGAALEALWKKHITTKEMFNVLSLPKENASYRNYLNFLWFLPSKLEDEDIIHGLHWILDVKEGLDKENFNCPIELVNTIIYKAWHLLEDENILKTLVKVIIWQSENNFEIHPIPKNEKLINSESVISEEIRKKLVLEIIRNSESFNWQLWFGNINPILISEKDFGWLLEELSNSDDQENETFLRILKQLRQYENRQQTELLCEYKEKISSLEKVFKAKPYGIEINSDEAQILKSSYKRSKQNNKIPKQKIKILPICERITKCLDDYDKGDNKGFWRIFYELSINESSLQINEYESDINKLESWNSCNEILRQKILDKGKKYITENKECTDEWLIKQIYYRPDAAAFKTFKLLYKHDLEYLKKLDAETWANWAFILIGYPETPEGGNMKDTSFLLIEKAYQIIPEEITNAILQIVKAGNNLGGYDFSFSKVVRILDEKLQKAILKEIEIEALNNSYSERFLSWFIQKGNKDASEFALSQLKEEVINEKRIENAIILLNSADDAAWFEIWKLINNEPELGKELFLAFSFRTISKNEKPFVDRISKKNIAKLYIWLRTHFPVEEDEKHIGTYSPTDRDTLADFRDGLKSYLMDIAAVEEIEYIIKEMPDINIEQSLNYAKDNYRRLNWKPIKPNDFFKLISNKDNYRENIEVHIKKGKIKPAFEIFLKTTKEKSKNDLHQNIVHLYSRFNRNEEDNLKGVISREDYNLEANKIIVALLYHLKEL